MEVGMAHKDVLKNDTNILVASEAHTATTDQFVVWTKPCSVICRRGNQLWFLHGELGDMAVMEQSNSPNIVQLSSHDDDYELLEWAATASWGSAVQVRVGQLREASVHALWVTIL